MSNRWLKIGAIGSVVTAICCFTPALVWLLASLGLSALTGALDIVLIPLLAVFILILGVGLWKKRQT